MYAYKNKFLLAAFIISVAIDQFSKYIIRSRGGFYVCNRNIAFGINLPDYIFWILWMIIIIFLLFFIFKKRLPHTTFYMLLILSGAISNMIDRAQFGCVIDFIDLKIWPVFNLADSLIAISVIILTIKYFKK